MTTYWTVSVSVVGSQRGRGGATGGVTVDFGGTEEADARAYFIDLVEYFYPRALVTLYEGNTGAGETIIEQSRGMGTHVFVRGVN